MGRADELRSDPRARAWAGAGVWPPPPFASASHTGAAATREASLLRTKLHLLVSHGASSLPPGLRGWLSYETWAPHTDVLVPAGAMLLVWQLLVSFPLWAALLLLSLLATAAHQLEVARLIRVHTRFMAACVVSITAVSALELASLLPELRRTLGPSLALSERLLQPLRGCYIVAALLYALVARMDAGTVSRGTALPVHKLAGANAWRLEDAEKRGRVCSTCKCFRPLRSKHCSVTNRCIRRYDHYCPIFHNAIGQRNQVAFVLFLAVYLAGQLLFAVVAFIVLRSDWQCWSATSERLAMQAKGLTRGVHRCYGTPVPHAALLLLTLCNVPATLFCAFLLLRALVGAAANLTVNEMENWRRYPYMSDLTGAYSNLFDDGILWNLYEFLSPVAVEYDEVVDRQLAKDQNDTAAHALLEPGSMQTRRAKAAPLSVAPLLRYLCHVHANYCACGAAAAGVKVTARTTVDDVLAAMATNQNASAAAAASAASSSAAPSNTTAALATQLSHLKLVDGNAVRTISAADAMRAGLFLDPNHITFEPADSTAPHPHSHSPSHSLDRSHGHGAPAPCRAEHCAAPQRPLAPSAPGSGSAAAGGGESERADTGMWLSAPPPLLHHQGPPRPELQAAALAKQVDALPRRMHAGGDGGGGYSSGMASVLPTAVLPTRMFPSGALDGRMTVDQLMQQMQQRGVHVQEVLFSPGKTTSAASGAVEGEGPAAELPGPRRPHEVPHPQPPSGGGGGGRGGRRGLAPRSLEL